MKADQDRVQKLIGSMRDATRLLTELRDMDLEEFLVNEHMQSSAMYNFIAAIEAAIDIGNHLISMNGIRAPEGYADTFMVLSEAGIVDETFSLELQKMARFRNRLVHRYWDVDVAELRRILEERLGDFERYIADVGNCLE